MKKKLLQIVARSLSGPGFEIGKDDLLAMAEEADLLDLMAAARLAVSASGLEPFTCGILNVKSGQCGEDCVFCSQSAHYQTTAETYPLLTQHEILARAESLAGRGIKYLGLVTSGASLSEKDFGQLLKTVTQMKSRFDFKICASLGSLTPERAVSLKAAGLTSYHHNLESSREFFQKICTTHTLDGKIETVKAAGQAGLRVCCGGIFGLGETWSERLDLALLLAELEVDAIPINFLRPVPGTPSGKRPTLPIPEALRLVALFRLANPGKDLHICGGRELTLGHLKSLAFCAGANGIMVGDYLTCPGSNLSGDLDEMRALGLLS